MTHGAVRAQSCGGTRGEGRPFDSGLAPPRKRRSYAEIRDVMEYTKQNAEQDSWSHSAPLTGVRS